jgi:hypothetical protein
MATALAAVAVIYLAGLAAALFLVLAGGAPR